MDSMQGQDYAQRKKEFMKKIAESVVDAETLDEFNCALDTFLHHNFIKREPSQQTKLVIGGICEKT